MNKELFIEELNKQYNTIKIENDKQTQKLLQNLETNASEIKSELDEIASIYQYIIKGGKNE